MGRNSAIDWLPRYREVLVTTAVRAVRERLPAVRAFAAEPRSWLAVAADERGWRAVAVAAGAVPDQAVSR
jgi:hypothetical protein